ncbi:MAG: carbohydrate ABC transporter substrate-binding protein, partial [Lachnospiraceae bacterium]|nr:carbohydrate ABC transporter substrate-binding protein [Lachnospiraceae bacterium]
ASEADQKATLDFMKWVVTSEAGTKCMAEQMGSIPYKGAAEVDNIFLQNANDMLAAGNYNVDWTFNYTPNVNDWRATLVAAMNKYDNGGSWDDVVTAFVKGWENQYNAANAN